MAHSRRFKKKNGNKNQYAGSGYSQYNQLELLPLFTDEAVSGIITALLSGETPETLEKRWRSMGENACPERIARGDAVLSRDELGVEHIARLTEELASNASRRWYERLKLAVVSGEATDEEKKAYFDCARRLKGGV